MRQTNSHKKAQTSKEGLFPPFDQEVSQVETANVE